MLNTTVKQIYSSRCRAWGPWGILGSSSVPMEEGAAQTPASHLTRGHCWKLHKESPGSVSPGRIWGLQALFPSAMVFPFHWSSLFGLRAAPPFGTDEEPACACWQMVFHHPTNKPGAGGSGATQSGSELWFCLTQRSENTSTELLWPLKWLQS